jgi:hypothetical protein
MMPALKTRLAERVKARPRLVVGALTLMLVVVMVGGGVAGALLARNATTATPANSGPPVDWAPQTPPPLLPGETLWRGVPSMLWGTNDTQNWDAEKNLITLPVIQKRAKADHLALIRTWLFQYDLVTNQPVTDAYQQSKVRAALNTGARLLCELPTANSMAYDEHMAQLFAGKCSYYEFMNEPDDEQIPVATYVSQGASEIPRRYLRLSVGERDSPPARD